MIPEREPTVLTAEERRRLRELEAAWAADDPRLHRCLSTGGATVRGRAGVAMVLAGAVAMVAFVAAAPFLAVAGAALAGVGMAVAAPDTKRIGGQWARRWLQRGTPDPTPPRG